MLRTGIRARRANVAQFRSARSNASTTAEQAFCPCCLVLAIARRACWSNSRAAYCASAASSGATGRLLIPVSGLCEAVLSLRTKDVTAAVRPIPDIRDVKVSSPKRTFRPGELGSSRLCCTGSTACGHLERARATNVSNAPLSRGSVERATRLARRFRQRAGAVELFRDRQRNHRSHRACLDDKH
jgi:hypothetical protein